MDTSVYQLITQLCDKFIDKRKCLHEHLNVKEIIKKLRSTAFETLLKKKYITEFDDFEENTDPICQLLALQYVLKNKNDLPEKANSLGCFIELINNSGMLNNPVIQNVLLFLLHLRGSCPETTENEKYTVLDAVKLQTISDEAALPYNIYQNSKFLLNHPPKSSTDLTLKNYSNKLFTRTPSLTLSLTNKPDKISYNINFNFASFEDEECTLSNSDTSLKTEENIWSFVSKLPINENRTWESLHSFDRVKELPFALESSLKVLHLLQDILRVDICYPIDLCNNYVQEFIVSHEDFIKCVKYMLVGISSHIFAFENNCFCLKYGVCIEGLSTDAIISYCEDLIYCGSCYKILHDLCSPHESKTNESNGYIYHEFCKSICRYLTFYRVVALSCADTSNFLTILSRMKPFKNQINMLMRLCGFEGYPRLKGANLLDLIYQELIRAIDKNVVLVLWSIFYPCCQFYYSHFLHRWIFEGTLIDQYEEFLIRPDPHYNSQRNRSYWTRGFRYQKAIPQFLKDLKSKIVYCGKTMDLLLLCNPNTLLYSEAKSRSIPLITCCITQKQMNSMMQEIDCHFLKMSSLCVSICLYHEMKSRYGINEDTLFMSLVEEKRARTLKQLELRKQKEAEEKARMKRKAFEELREQIRISKEQKRKAKEEQIKQDLLLAEQNAKMEEMRSELVKTKSKFIVKYYTDLIDAVDKRRTSFELRRQKLLDLSNDSLMTVGSRRSMDSDLSFVVDSDSINNSRALEEVKSSELNKLETIKESELLENEKEMNLEKVLVKVTKDSSTINLDIKNANIIKNKDDISAVELCNQKNENFLAAQRNKAKVLNLEFNTEVKPEIKTKELTYGDTDSLTEAQKNKLKVLSSEYNANFEYAPKTSEMNKQISQGDAESLTDAQMNKLKVLSSDYNTNFEFKQNNSEIIENTYQCNIEKLTEAQRNKLKMLSSEFDVNVQNKRKSSETKVIHNNTDNLTEAQKIKLKVLSSEYGTDFQYKSKAPEIINKALYNTESLTEAERNKLKVLSSEFDINFQYKQKINEANGNFLDNVKINEENGNNTNMLIVPAVINDLASPGHEDVMNLNHRKKIMRSPKQNESVTIYDCKSVDVMAMSIDSMPNTEISESELATPSSAKLSLNTDIYLDSANILDSCLTSNSYLTEEGFKFPESEPIVESDSFHYEKSMFSSSDNKHIFDIAHNDSKLPRLMQITKSDVKDINIGKIKNLLRESVAIPLEAQIKLVNNEILKHFILDRGLFSHLNSIRNYFFLLDGEFCRCITESLFTKLHTVSDPVDLFNFRTLQLIIETSLQWSSKIQENGERLSFIIRHIPACLDLNNTDIFECLSLSYALNWPLNILISYEAFKKYDLIFKFLLKLNYMSWILKNIFQDLKSLQSEIRIDENLLGNSEQYQKIQFYRFVMTQFIQTLQNYIAGEVLHSSWDEFVNNLKTVTTFDELYVLHCSYIKSILHKCMLNKKLESMSKIYEQIFITILKFYNYLKAGCWTLLDDDICYSHSKYHKMAKIFIKFQQFAASFYKIGNKLAVTGSQTELVQMLDTLNHNNYYSTILE